MEHMGGRNVVQTRLSLGELHKVVQRKGWVYGEWKKGGRRHGTAVLNLGLTVCTFVLIPLCKSCLCTPHRHWEEWQYNLTQTWH